MRHRGIYSNIPAFHINDMQKEVGAVQQRDECVCMCVLGRRQRVKQLVLQLCGINESISPVVFVNTIFIE